jgi:sugar phosphate isomerase/epimerase
MAAQHPRVSVSQISTLHASFEEDLEAYAASGLDGIGIWELKLGEGPVDGALAAFESSPLAAASAVPAVPSILPLPLLPGPDDPRERIDAILASLHRLAPFRPSGIVCLTGSGEGRDPDDARTIVAEGLRELGREAASLGRQIAVEPYQLEDGERWSIVSSVPEALALVADAGDGAGLALQFDVWHLWNTETVFDDIPTHVHRFAGVHVCDRRNPTRGWADRELPGNGEAGVPALLRALDDAGWDGLYDIEVFSDDGTFGNCYQDSYWQLEPSRFLTRARSSFDDAWHESFTPRPSHCGGQRKKESR